MRVTGEASPDYLVSRGRVLQNMLRYAPRMKILVSLRDPLERCLSAYANKRADGTVHRHLLKNLHRAWSVDRRKDGEVEASFFKGKPVN